MAQGALAIELGHLIPQPKSYLDNWVGNVN